MTAYAENLKTIVGLNTLKKETIDQTDKTVLNGLRGIGYTDAISGAVNGAAGVAPTDTTPGLNPIVDPSSKVLTQTATDAAIAATVGALSPSVNNSITGAALLGALLGSSALLGVTKTAADGAIDILKAILVASNASKQRITSLTNWKDIVTGKPMQYNVDGVIRPPPGIGVPDANSDRAYQGFIAGFRWDDTHGNFFPSAEQAAASWVAIQNTGLLPIDRLAYGIIQVTGPVSGAYTANVDIYVITNPASHGSQAFDGSGCSIGIDSACLIDAPTTPYWSPQATTQLIQDNGNFIAPARDSSAPFQFKTPSGAVIGQASDGSFFKIVPTTDKGVVVGTSGTDGTYTAAEMRQYSVDGQWLGPVTITGLPILVKNGTPLP